MRRMGRKSWLTLLLAVTLCVAPGLGWAAFDTAPVEPLVNAVLSAALETSQTSIAEGDALTEESAGTLLSALQTAGVISSVADPAEGEKLLEGLLAVDAPKTVASGELELREANILAVDASEDGGAAMLVAQVGEGDDAVRAVIELRQDEASSIGWKMYRMTMEDAELMNAVVVGYVTSEMNEYVNTACGFSIQYPALFTDELLVDTPEGRQAALPDESASFSVTRVANAEGLTLEELLELEKSDETSDAPAAETAINEILGCGTSVVTDAEGYTHTAIFYVSEAYIYEAELNYLTTQAESYEPYVEIMMNSFMVDELGAG